MDTSRIRDADRQQIDQALNSLCRPSRSALADRLQWIESCLPLLAQQSTRWVTLSCQHKGIPTGDGARAEELLAGPVVVMRFFRLIQQTLRSIERSGMPTLPGTPTRGEGGEWHVPVFPARGLYDGLLFPGIRAHVRLSPSRDPGNLFADDVNELTSPPQGPPPVTLVLGAGNVSAIPATDAATKILCHGSPVLLKLNPVNAYLRPVWEQALQPLIDANQLRIVEGGADVGEYAAHHAQVAQVHMTGSHRSHDALVWGSDPAQSAARKLSGKPLLSKPVTSELGNVTPWIVIPGSYSKSELRSQAEHIASSITNNAAFNCLATRVLITARDWPQRDNLLQLIEDCFDRIPYREAYYPGAHQRFTDFTELPCDTREPRLPWTLLRDVDAQQPSRLFSEESFVCVCAETRLAAPSPSQFLDTAVNFCNDRLFGTLCAAMSVPRDFARGESASLERALGQLRYGTVSINQWPGTSYGIMSTPWGAYPGESLASVQSGIGMVHNTYLLGDCKKTVLSAPLKTPTHPVWFPSHRRAEATGWHLLGLYTDSRISHLPPLLWAALRP